MCGWMENEDVVLLVSDDGRSFTEMITDLLIPASLERGRRLRSVSLHIAKSNLQTFIWILLLSFKVQNVPEESLFRNEV